MVQFFNPHEDECHHTVLCSYFGDMFVKPKDCCEKCDPSLLESHREAIKEYMLSLTCTGPKRKLLASRLPGSSFKRLPSDLTKCALQKLLIWCHQTWADCVLSLNDLNVTSPEIMLGETDLVAFVSCIHIISTRQHFDFLTIHWVSVSPLTPLEVNNLWDTVQAMNEELQTALQHRKEEEAAKIQSKKNHVKLEVHNSNGLNIPNEDLSSVVSTRDVEVPNGKEISTMEPPGEQGRGKCMKIRSERGVMIDAAQWMDELRKTMRK